MTSLFDGKWQIDLEESLVLDDVAKKHVRDGQDVITLRTVGDVQDYEVLYGDQPKIRVGDTACFDGSRMGQLRGARGNRGWPGSPKLGTTSPVLIAAASRR